MRESIWEKRDIILRIETLDDASRVYAAQLRVYIDYTNRELVLRIHAYVYNITYNIHKHATVIVGAVHAPCVSVFIYVCI